MLFVNIQKQLPTFTIQFKATFKKEITVILGPSGSGKTTILNCLAGLKYPESGMIKLNEKPLYATDQKRIPPQERKVAYLFQDVALFPHMSVQKNIYYALHQEAEKEEMNLLIQKLQITHLLDKYPHEISGGEQQRVALARALSTKPHFLLLDEPFSALDDQTRSTCHKILLHLYKEWDIPVIMVTHHQQEANILGDRLIHIKAGKIIKDEVPIFKQEAMI